jgi:hypothetical protein
MTDTQIIAARRRGEKVADIATESGRSEKRVQAVLRKAGMCRDQRPVREYAVTVMVPEIVRVDAVSDAQARRAAKELFGDNVRVSAVDEVNS